NAVGETLGAADKEGGIGSAIAPDAEPLREGFAREHRAAPVERDNRGTFRNGVEEQRRLACLHLRGRKLALFFDLDERQRREDAHGIELFELLERPGLLPADRDDREPHPPSGLA